MRSNPWSIFWPKKKRELYWPGSDQLYMDFPSEIYKSSVFVIMLILTPYILVSSLVVIPNPNLGLSVVGSEFICAHIGRPFLFYSSHLCSCGSTLGDIF